MPCGIGHVTSPLNFHQKPTFVFQNTNLFSKYKLYTAHNPADVGTRDNKAKKSDCLALWLKGPKFLCESNLDACSPVNVVSVTLDLLSTRITTRY